MANPLIESLLQAVAARPDDVPLRLHLADLLITDERRDEAVHQCAVALQHDPASARARELMTRTLGAPQPADDRPGFDWDRAEDQFGDGPAPMFVTDEESPDDREPMPVSWWSPFLHRSWC